MKNENLRQERALRSVLLVLLLCAVGMTNAFAANHDFAAVAANGQTLYYKITNSTTHTVKVTHPYDGTSNISDHCCPVKTDQKFFEIIEN